MNCSNGCVCKNKDCEYYPKPLYKPGRCYIGAHCVNFLCKFHMSSEIIVREKELCFKKNCVNNECLTTQIHHPETKENKLIAQILKTESEIFSRDRQSRKRENDIYEKEEYVNFHLPKIHKMQDYIEELEHKLSEYRKNNKQLEHLLVDKEIQIANIEQKLFNTMRHNEDLETHIEDLEKHK